MRANQKEYDWHRQKVLLGRRVLVTVIDLLPHVEIVICTRVEVEGYTAHPVEHEVGAGHVCEVCEGPGGLLRYARDDIIDNLQAEYENWVDEPSSFCVDPFRVQVWQSCLVT